MAIITGDITQDEPILLDLGSKAGDIGYVIEGGQLEELVELMTDGGYVERQFEFEQLVEQLIKDTTGADGSPPDAVEKAELNAWADYLERCAAKLREHTK